MNNIAFTAASILTISSPLKPAVPIFVPNISYSIVETQKEQVLSEKSISMNDRYGNEYVNNVFKDNILLTLDYMSGDVKGKSDIDWSKVEANKHFEFTLEPGQRFAFHDQILPEYGENVVKTTNAHFNYADGFKSDGYLMGDGVCHLASLIYWAAKDAGLDAYAPTNHNFAVINEIPKEYGVAIYAAPGAFSTSARQNLYIKNNLDKTVKFVFDYDGTNLSLKLVVDNQPERLPGLAFNEFAD